MVAIMNLISFKLGLKSYLKLIPIANNCGLWNHQPCGLWRQEFQDICNGYESYWGPWQHLWVQQEGTAAGVCGDWWCTCTWLQGLPARARMVAGAKRGHTCVVVMAEAHGQGQLQACSWCLHWALGLGSSWQQLEKRAGTHIVGVCRQSQVPLEVNAAERSLWMWICWLLVSLGWDGTTVGPSCGVLSGWESWWCSLLSFVLEEPFWGELLLHTKQCQPWGGDDVSKTDLPPTLYVELFSEIWGHCAAAASEVDSQLFLFRSSGLIAGLWGGWRLRFPSPPLWWPNLSSFQFYKRLWKTYGFQMGQVGWGGMRWGFGMEML